MKDISEYTAMCVENVYREEMGWNLRNDDFFKDYSDPFVEVQQGTLSITEPLIIQLPNYRWLTTQSNLMFHIVTGN